MIRDNLNRIKENISSVCQKIDTNPEDIKLVCITKQIPVETILEALECGIKDIGENRVQEAQNKYLRLKQILLKSQRVNYHMVGHLQTNKVKLALSLFDLIQSVDSLRLAKTIEKEVGLVGKDVEVLIQVNTSGQLSKFGVGVEGALDLIDEISKLNHIYVLGLMTIAPQVNNSEETRVHFKKLRLLKEKIEKEFKHPHIQMKYLSMGMSQDYQVALEEGSNMLRIGRAIFESTD